MSAALESIARERDAIGRRRSDALPSIALAERLDALHREGLEAFDAHGIPTRRLERWKGTSLAPLEAMAFARIGGGSIEADAIGSSSADLVFVDGRIAHATTNANDLPAGISVLSLAKAAADDPQTPEIFLGRLAESKTDGLAALQNALFEDAAVLHLAAGVQADRPIRILSLSTSTADASPSACFPRLLVVARRGAQATIVFESRSEGDPPGYTSLVAEYFLAAGARIESVELQDEGASRIHMTQTFAKLERDASFDSHVLTLGEGIVRSELTVRLEEPGAETRMRGFFLGRGRAHIDHYTSVDHEAPHCTSDEEYRGVLDDDSRGVFRGRVIIRPDAQKSDARQSNANLLLSDRAAIDTKPQLEIYADDVKASHGSTIGHLDPDALFFLRARGIDETSARLLLTRGFAQEIVDGIRDASVRAEIVERVDRVLSEHAAERANRSGSGSS